MEEGVYAAREENVPAKSRVGRTGGKDEVRHYKRRLIRIERPINFIERLLHLRHGTFE